MILFYFLLFYWYAQLHHYKKKHCNTDLLDRLNGVAVPSLSVPARPVIVYPLNKRYRGLEKLGRNPPAILMGVRLVNGPDKRRNSAYELRGKPYSYIKIPNAGRMDTRKAMTILIWAFPKNRIGPIVQFGNQGFAVRLWMMRRNMVFAEFVTRQSRKKKPYLASIDGVQPWKWNHFGMSYDKASGTATLYVNSKPVVRKQIGSFDLSTNHDVYLGARPGDKQYFRGRVSCLQFFDRALSSHQVKQMEKKCFRFSGNLPNKLVQNTALFFKNRTKLMDLAVSHMRVTKRLAFVLVSSPTLLTA